MQGKKERQREREIYVQDGQLTTESKGPSKGERLLHRLADLCEREREIIATVEAWDNGKPYDSAHSALNKDIAKVIPVLCYYAEWADKIYGQTIDTSE